jgi:hypothetical protein
MKAAREQANLRLNSVSATGKQARVRQDANSAFPDFAVTALEPN